MQVSDRTTLNERECRIVHVPAEDGRAVVTVEVTTDATNVPNTPLIAETLTAFKEPECPRVAGSGPYRAKFICSGFLDSCSIEPENLNEQLIEQSECPLKRRDRNFFAIRLSSKTKKGAEHRRTVGKPSFFSSMTCEFDRHHGERVIFAPKAMKPSTSSACRGEHELQLHSAQVEEMPPPPSEVDEELWLIFSGLRSSQPALLPFEMEDSQEQPPADDEECGPSCFSPLEQHRQHSTTPMLSCSTTPKPASSAGGCCSNSSSLVTYSCSPPRRSTNPVVMNDDFLQPDACYFPPRPTHSRPSPGSNSYPHRGSLSPPVSCSPVSPASSPSVSPVTLSPMSATFYGLLPSPGKISRGLYSVEEDGDDGFGLLRFSPPDCGLPRQLSSY
ncbi:hypothetical protein Pelo_3160 [Pelomyxa schiedti]|nr:hypothetical protein Pelo_3160 [Pelomyxa schiedti]